MSKKDIISEILDADHTMNYRTGKYEPIIDKSVVAEDTYQVIDEQYPVVIESEDGDDDIIPISQDELDYLEDESIAKDNIKRLIEDGMDLVEDLYENVRASEQPKSFEYAALFMKSLVEMNEALLDIHDRKKKRNEIKTKKDKGGTTISQVNNNIHIHESKPTNLLKKLKSK